MDIKSHPNQCSTVIVKLLHILLYVLVLFRDASMLFSALPSVFLAHLLISIIYLEILLSVFACML